MTFVRNMAWREMRAAWHRLLLFFMCIALGVGAMVSLRSFTDIMRGAIEREVRALYGGDVRVGLNQEWKPETRAVLERYTGSTLVIAHTEVLETQTMVRAAEHANARPVMVQLAAVQDGFPLYGRVQLARGVPYSHALLRGRGVLVPEGLRAQLGLDIGGTLKIGTLTFTVRGIVEKLPAAGMNFSPTPRVALDYADAAPAGLLGFGSLVRRSWLFRTPEGDDELLLGQLERDLRSTRLNWLGSFRGQQAFVNSLLERLEGFLGLVGLTILVLGGIGISSVARVFVEQKVKTIAILKCLGGDNRRVLGTYLAQVVVLSLVGSLAGLGLARAIAQIGARYLAGRLPVEFEPGLTWQASLQGVAVGLLVALLFSLAPLLRIRDVKPILVLRPESAAGEPRRWDWLQIGARLLITPALLGLAVWQAGSTRNAGIFIGALVGTGFVLNLAGSLLIRSLRRVPRLPSFALRQGVGSLHRPGNQTRVILFTVGLGALFLVAIRQYQVTALAEYSLDLDSVSGDMFLADVQRDQRPALEDAIARLGGAPPRLLPIVQGRIVGLKRDPSNTTRLAAGWVRQRLRWEERFTYRPRLEATEKIVAGQFWDDTPGASPEISVEEEFSRVLELGIGDTLSFDFPGRRVEARITSIRRHERRIRPISYLTRFTILFRPGALEQVPQMFLGLVQGPPPGERRAAFQRALVEEFVNVTVIDAFDTIAELRKRLSEGSFAVSVIGGFVFLSGGLILTGSIGMTKYHRLYEAAILKTLGAKKRLIAVITLVEYGVLGLLAGLIGSAAAIALTWAVSTYGIGIPWRFVPAVNLWGAGATLLLVVVVGVLSSWDVLVKKPLGILRSE